MALDDARMAALRSAKLRSLVAATIGIDGDDVALPSTETTLVGCVVNRRSYVLADVVRDLGSALHWHQRQVLSGDSESLTVFAQPVPAGHLARRAGLVSGDVTVMAIEGGSAIEATPTPLADPPELSDEMWRAAGLMADAGARVVDDNGRLTAEVHGLEVARVSRSESDEAVELHVGVGEADRELHGYVHGHLDDLDKLRRAVETVRAQRRPGTALHPLTRLARPRWIRSQLLAEPGLVGLNDLEPQAPLQPYYGVFDGQPAAAYAPSERVTVVCSSGVDLDLIPEAVDYRRRIDPDSQLLVVLPERDRRLATAGLIGLVPGIEVRSVQPPWESVAS